MSEFQEDNDRWAAQTGGALRGMVLGIFRVVTRPAQMKVIIWLAKRKWKNRKTSEGGKSSHVSRPHLLSNIVVESAIGAAMYDIYDRSLVYCKDRGMPGGLYVQTAAAGAVAGWWSAVMTVPHNNAIQWHADTTKSLVHAFKTGEITVTGKHGLFKGLRHACIRDTAAVSAMFTSSLWFKRNLPQPPPDSLPLTTFHAFCAGGLAGMVATTIALPFTRQVAWSTQYPGTHYLTLAKKLATRDAVSVPKYLIAGAPPAILAAFLPNAMGMAAMNVSGFLNRIVEEELQKNIVIPGYDDENETSKGA
eukprot:TRINITY_DN16965_c0_g2_i3.p1 TRINITY_DN16965_c0_g2~~TRINITY_DN16965_c0_g2_i3.p1  ORF type:complete len:305 (+),score=49.05 TRINITY_DN16965_c0_g2_i3:250-1164(+)